MVNYWKEKVLPKIKKVFDKNGPKKTAAAEATKAFDDAKEEYSKEFEDKKSELQPKVVEIYEASSTELKGLIKTPKDSGLKKHAPDVQKFLDELVKIEFPGSKAVAEASSKLGPVYVSGPVSFLFEKVSTFIVVPEDEQPAAIDVKEKEILLEGSDNKTEQELPETTTPATTEPPPTAAAAAAEAPPPPPPEAAPAPAPAEAPKVDEPPPPPAAEAPKA